MLAVCFSALIIIAAPAILLFALPLSASQALNGRPSNAHELGFWLVLLLSLPFWLLGTWLSVLAIITGPQARRKKFRRMIWGLALVLTLLAGAALGNVLGFGDVFAPA